MANHSDPTAAMRRLATGLADVTVGESCNQAAFKVGRASFLFLGPGAKGNGYKAMFKLRESMTEAVALAERFPVRFEVGKTGWVTARFSAEDPLAEKLWKRWVVESHAFVAGGGRQTATPRRGRP